MERVVAKAAALFAWKEGPGIGLGKKDKTYSDMEIIR